MKKVLGIITIVFLVVESFAACSVLNENTVNDAISDEYIIEKFNEAYDFWVSWIYGQDKDYEFLKLEDRIDFGPYLCAVSKDAPIQSVDEFKIEMEKHFTNELCERFLKATGPVNIEGRLCMYGFDVGGPYSGPEKITIERLSDEKYRLKLDIWSYMDEDEPDLPDMYVYYVLEDGEWKFKNDTEDEFFCCEKLPEYLNDKYAPYNSVLKKYCAALHQKWNSERIAEEGLTNIVMYNNGRYEGGKYQRSENPLENMGYCLIDINKDGVNELLIGQMGDNVIYDLYTVKDGSAHNVALGWERNRYYVYEEDGEYRIARECSSGASLNSNDNYILENGELKHVWSVIMNGFASEHNPWFMAYDGEFDVSNDTPITEDEYWETINEYNEKYIAPEYIPFSNLM